MRLIDADALDYELGVEDRDIYVRECLLNAPTVQMEPHWIPCSLRLPERSVEVLTYTETVGLTEIQSLEQDKNGFMYWENQHGDIQDMTVTAWMPLPEPINGVTA